MNYKKIISFLNVDLVSGGCEREISRLLHYYKNKFILHLVLFNEDISYPLPDNITVKSLDTKSQRSNLFKMLEIPFLAYKYAKYCKSNNISVSLSYVYRSNYVNILSKIIFRNPAKIIVNEQNHTLTQYSGNSITSRINRFLIKSLYPYADVIRPNSKLIARDLTLHFGIVPSLITTIYNPLSLTFISNELKESVKFPYDGFNFVSAARLHYQKNPILLIKAFYSAFKSHENVNMLLLGEGPMKDEINTLITELGLEKRIHLHGFVSNPFAFLGNCDCFVLSSDFEGFPNSLLEALACGLPSISTDCPSGPREMLAPNTPFTKSLRDHIEITDFGILVPTSNIDLLASAMQTVYADYNLREVLKRNSKIRAQDFDISLFDEQLLPLL